MMKHKAVIITIAAVIGLAFSVPAFAGFGGKPFHRPGFHRGDGGIMRLLRDLDLTDEQKEAVKVIVSSARESIEPIAEQLQELELEEAMFAEEINVSGVEQKIDTMVGLRSKIVSIKADSQMEVSRVLTPEQRTIVLERIHKNQRRAQHIRGKIRDYAEE